MAKMVPAGPLHVWVHWQEQYFVSLERIAPLLYEVGVIPTDPEKEKLVIKDIQLVGKL